MDGNADHCYSGKKRSFKTFFFHKFVYLQPQSEIFTYFKGFPNMQFYYELTCPKWTQFIFVFYVRNILDQLSMPFCLVLNIF